MLFTRWNSVYLMIDSILQSFGEIYDVLTTKQRLRNEARMNNGKQFDHEILELIEVLNKDDLIEIKQFLEPFKVNSRLW